MNAPWPAMAAVLAALAALAATVGALKLVERRWRPHPELLRKAVHVGMGLVVLTFPWLFDQALPVVTLAALAAAGLVLLRLVPRLRDGPGTVLAGVGRTSLGEVYYPLAVAVLFTLTLDQDALLFVVPMLLLTLADAAAALIGRRYATVCYQSGDGTKSAEGSVAFFMVAFLSVHVPVLLFSDASRLEALLVAAILALLVMLLECAAWHGLDNLLIPLGGYAFLRLYLDMPAETLWLRLVATIALVMFTLAWRRRSSLDDGALVAAALIGYAAVMLGGWLWLLPPLIVFVAHAIAWPRADGPRYHHVPAVMSVAAAGLLWLFIAAVYDAPGLIYPYAVSFAAHLAILGISHRTEPGRPGRPAWVLSRSLLGWALCLLPVLALQSVLHPGGSDVRPRALAAAAALAAVLLAAAVFYALLPILYRPPLRPGAIYATGACLGLVASVLAALAAGGVAEVIAAQGQSWAAGARG